MLQQIGSKRSGDDAPRGIVPRLADCHARIRRFTATTVKLGAVAGAMPQEIREAAAGCISYFGKALPHHSADEDESIAPHLAGDPQVAEAVATVAAQHREIHAVIDALMPLWRTIEAAPDTLPAAQPALARLSADLEARFDAHLRLEEDVLFPVIDALPDDVQADVVRAMVKRRLP